MHRFSVFMLFFFSWLVFSALAVASTPPQDAGSRILILGDSLSAAHNIPVEKSWPVLLQERLGNRAQVINASISGETSVGGRQRLPALLEQHHPDILILELGGNDGLRGFRFGQTRENLTAMIEMARRAGARVLLVGVRMPPNLGAAYGRRFQKIYRDLAEKTGVALLPRFLEGIAASDPALMQGDGIHPTAKAQPMLAERIQKELTRWLP